MARAKVLTQRAAAKGLGTYRQDILKMLIDGRLTRAELNGAIAVKDDAKYQALLAVRATNTESAA